MGDREANRGRDGEKERQTDRHRCERETLIGCFPYVP